MCHLHLLIASQSLLIFYCCDNVGLFFMDRIINKVNGFIIVFVNISAAVSILTARTGDLLSLLLHTSTVHLWWHFLLILFSVVILVWNTIPNQIKFKLHGNIVTIAKQQPILRFCNITIIISSKLITRVLANLVLDFKKSLVFY